MCISYFDPHRHSLRQVDHHFPFSWGDSGGLAACNLQGVAGAWWLICCLMLLLPRPHVYWAPPVYQSLIFVTYLLSHQFSWDIIPVLQMWKWRLWEVKWLSQRRIVLTKDKESGSKPSSPVLEGTAVVTEGASWHLANPSGGEWGTILVTLEILVAVYMFILVLMVVLEILYLLNVSEMPGLCLGCKDE